MTKSFYSFAIFFLGLSVVAGLFQSIIYFQLGTQIYFLQPMAHWFLVISIIALVGTLCLLKYYHYKQFQFTFWALTISTAASLYHFILFYNLLKTRELSGEYIVATLIVIGMGVIYALSLIFSEAGKRPWLKAAGIFSGFLGLITLSFLIWGLNSITIRQDGTMEKMEQWISLIGSLGPVLLIMNFLNERATAEKAYTSRQRSLTTYMDLITFVALVSTVVFGAKVGSESIRFFRNPDHVSDYLKKIAQPFEARTYVNSDGDSLQYRLMMPLDYDSTQQYPLVVCLHGSSGCGTDNVKQVVASLPVQLLSTRENRTKYPAFLFVPQCPPKMGWGGIPKLPAVDALVFETIRALEEEFPIDENRRYVAGNSLGGYGAWHLICTHPEMFAAAIPISGGGNPALAQNIVDVPVWAFHGAEDRNVPVSGSRDIIEAIKNAGGSPRYTEYPDERHDIWEKVKSTPGLLEWFFAQERD